jgi:hypothetical protein
MMDDTPAKMLIHQAYSLPAILALLVRDDHTVEIRSFYIQDRGQGGGSKVLRAITDLADDLDVTLEVCPLSAVEHGWWNNEEDVSDSLNQNDLVAWYIRNGFLHVPHHDRWSVQKYDDYMVRRPRSDQSVAPRAS